VNETFDLGLSMTVTDFQRGAVLGHLTRSMSDEEIVAHVEQHIQWRCGFIPDYADPLEGINLFEWLFWCAEAMEYGPGHIPGDEINDHLSQDYYRTGAVLRNVRAALDTGNLEKLLARPVDAILERVLRGG
jgi:hypothetical protein